MTETEREFEDELARLDRDWREKCIEADTLRKHLENAEAVLTETGERLREAERREKEACDLANAVHQSRNDAVRKAAELAVKIGRLEEELAAERRGGPHEQPLTDEPMDRQVVVLNRQLAEKERELNQARSEARDAGDALKDVMESLRSAWVRADRLLGCARGLAGVAQRLRKSSILIPWADDHLLTEFDIEIANFEMLDGEEKRREAH